MHHPSRRRKALNTRLNNVLVVLAVCVNPEPVGLGALGERSTVLCVVNTVNGQTDSLLHQPLCRALACWYWLD